MHSVNTVNLNKKSMRQAMLKDIKNLSTLGRAEASVKIQEKLALKLAGQSGLWAAYMPLSCEPNLNFLKVNPNIEWCFPLLAGNNLLFKKSVTQFKSNSLGFSEPEDGVMVPVKEISGFIIPGLAFDKAGTRLGRGQGYFDRALKNYKGPIVGVCFHLALKDLVPTEDHDLKCQTVLTENTTVETRGVKSWS